MNYSLENLDKAIDRWMKRSMRSLYQKAIDKKYRIDSLRENYSIYETMFVEENTPEVMFQIEKAYNNYRNGNFPSLEKTFSNDRNLIEYSHSAVQIEELLEERAIKKMILIIDPAYPLLSITDYKIINEKCRNEIFKKYKRFIIIMEVKRKLFDNQTVFEFTCDDKSNGAGSLESQVQKEGFINKPNIFCKTMPLEIALQHFKVFIERNNSNEMPFLTTKQFESFIDRGFHGNLDIEKQKFNCTWREKYFIVKRFVEFYDLALINEYENTIQCKSKYLQLLTDNFTNWTFESINGNFKKRGKKRW